MLKTLSTVIILLAALSAAAQTRTFRWDDELCQYRGTYDVRRFSETRLKNTLRLARSAGSFPLATNTTAFKIADIATLDVAELDREYELNAAELRSLDIVSVPYWETFRKRKIKELDQAYRLNRVSMMAYSDPRSLLTYGDASECMVKYARPLVSGGEDLLIAWRGVNELIRKRNGDPENIRRIYEEQLESPDKMQYAMIEVINFGWFNCANELIDYVTGDEVPAREFKKLFRNVKTLRCDEP